MSTPIALQLYSVRESLAKDFEGGVRRVAAMGYQGVETAGFAGTTPQAAGKLFKSLGLKVPSAHIFPPPVGPKLDEALDTLAAIDCKRIVAGFGPDGFKTLDAIKRSCEVFNQANAEARARGLTFAIHNHWWEYEVTEGRLPYKTLLELLDPTVLFEVDTYWVKVGGCDPAAVVKELGARATLLHIKDGPGVKTEPMLAIGDGVMDIPAVLAAGKDATEWLIVELDRCATDMFEAVAKSYRYLAGL